MPILLAEKIYISFYIQALVIIAIYMMFTGRYAGELHNFSLDITKEEVFILMIYSILSFIFAYYLYRMTIKKRLIIKKYVFKLNIVFFTNAYFILLITSFIFMINTGVGIVLSHATSQYSIIFGFLNVNTIFPFFYFLVRKSKEISRKYFFIIVTTFLIYRLLQGWSGIILSIFIFELYFYYKNKYIGKLKQIAIIVFLPLLFIFIGASLYQKVYPIKNEIRGLGYQNINYADGLVKLVNRLTYFPISVAAYSKMDEIKEFYQKEDIFLKESKGIFRPIIPRSIMENKEFRSLNNNVLQPFFPDITPYTSSDIGILMYVASLFNANWIDGLVVIILLITMLFIAKLVYDNLSQVRGQLDFLYFLLIVEIFTTTAPEIVFGYHFLGIFYFLPVLLIFGILKIQRKKNDN
ncbi:MAG: oligosaccharide repeat unit polymerase [Candidatus Gracilibacteria bacterium]